MKKSQEVYIMNIMDVLDQIHKETTDCIYNHGQHLQVFDQVLRSIHQWAQRHGWSRVLEQVYNQTFKERAKEKKTS